MLEKKDENYTYVSINKQNGFLEKENLLSTEIEASLDVDPLFSNPLQNVSLDRIEPLLFSMPLSEINLNQNPSPLMKFYEGSLQEVDNLEPVLVSWNEKYEEKQDSLKINEIKEENNISMSQITHDRFNNIRIFAISPRLDDQNENQENLDSELNNRHKSKLEELEKYKKEIEAIKKIQCFFRKFLFQKKKIVKKIQNNSIKVMKIKKCGDFYIWLKIIYDHKKKNHFVLATFIEIFKKKTNDFKTDSSRRAKNAVFKIDIPKDLALKILDCQMPFVWVKNFSFFFP